MTYQTALRRLYEISPRGIRLGLDRVHSALAALGNPHSSLCCVQVAGTNGKGSVANFVAHGAGAAGLKTGLYTSPHLHRFTERIRVNGQEANTELLGESLEQVLDLVDKEPGGGLTFFEVATVAAFLYFNKCQVDLAVLEVGLGGRLDATSVAAPDVTAITSIGLDHVELLGDSLASIAEEKAHIAQSGIPLVVGMLPAEALDRVEEIAGDRGAPLRVLGRDFAVSGDLKPPFPGIHQKQNAAVALEVFKLLATRFPGLTTGAFMDALPSAKWPGRFEIVDHAPRFILDGAHNLEATLALVQSLDSSGNRPDVLLFGGLRGKPVRDMLRVLSPKIGQKILVSPPIDRALDPHSYAEPDDRIAASVGQGIRMAAELAGKDATVLVTGSLFTVAEVRRILLDEPADPPIGL
ncbi:MAG: bifunctional folylpolyglutamate synthase/dihydrofolate synthase [Proteobacteria bacterium]|nr:bifunctional folylpolyglutamate synthase/dihydrofolate synthase [Pseudomonadota bacterium]